MRASDEPGAGRDGRASGPALFAWCLYDWANSAFPTVIVTFVFATYFTQAVAPTPEIGTAWWGWALGLSGIAVALLSPVLGAMADQGGRRKPWIGAFTVVCILLTAALWGIHPAADYAMAGLVGVAVANVAFELATVFYNAMLPGLAGRHWIGRLSGWGWGLGYAGGLACLVVSLLAFVQAEAPLFGLDREAAEHVRATAPLVALWMAVFALPLFVLTPDTPSGGLGPMAAARAGLAALYRTLRELGRYRLILRFLIARMIYTDGLNTLFAFGGIYAAGTFGMDFAEVIQFGIALNLTAGLGAAAFGMVDDRIGAKPTVVIALIALTALGAALLIVESKTVFWFLGLALGVFVGPAQAASRSFMARLAPPELMTEMFGLYALTGKATAFIGPLALGWATLAFSSQRAGMATILPFFVLGLALLLTVPEPRAPRHGGGILG